MVKIKGKEYDGYVVETDDDILNVIIQTIERLEDIGQFMADVSEVIDIKEGKETVYRVTAPLSARVLAKSICMFTFSTRPTHQQELEEKIQQQSDAIDDLLIAFLEG